MECYKSVIPNGEKCVAPCEGVYADVEKELNHEKVEEMRKFDQLMANYEEYKRGYEKDINYPKEIISMYCTENNISLYSIF